MFLFLAINILLWYQKRKQKLSYNYSAEDYLRIALFIPLFEEATFKYTLPALLPIFNNVYFNALVFSLLHITETSLTLNGSLHLLFCFMVGLMTAGFNNFKYAFYFHCWINLTSLFWNYYYSKPPANIIYRIRRSASYDTFIGGKVEADLITENEINPRIRYLHKFNFWPIQIETK